MKKNSIKKSGIKREISLDGMMVIGKLEDGRMTADFECFEDVDLEPVTGKFKAQVMRDGNMYMTQEKKRIRRKPICKFAHSSVTFGPDGFDRFIFILPSEQRSEFYRLLHQEAKDAGLFVDINYQR